MPRNSYETLRRQAPCGADISYDARRESRDFLTTMPFNSKKPFDYIRPRRPGLIDLHFSSLTRSGLRRRSAFSPFYQARILWLTRSYFSSRLAAVND